MPLPSAPRYNCPLAEPRRAVSATGRQAAEAAPLTCLQSGRSFTGITAEDCRKRRLIKTKVDPSILLIHQIAFTCGYERILSSFVIRAAFKDIAVAIMILSAGSAYEKSGRWTDFTAILLFTGTKCRYGSDSAIAMQSFTSIVN